MTPLGSLGGAHRTSTTEDPEAVTVGALISSGGASAVFMYALGPTPQPSIGNNALIWKKYSSLLLWLVSAAIQTPYITT